MKGASDGVCVNQSQLTEKLQ